MPREQINYARVGKTIAWSESQDGSQPGPWLEGSDDIDPEVSVVWSRDSFAQLSVEFDVAMAEGMLRDRDKGLSRLTLCAPPLDRDEINKLIRTLRKARDQVFGRDE